MKISWKDVIIEHKEGSTIGVYYTHDEIIKGASKNKFFFSFMISDALSGAKSNPSNWFTNNVTGLYFKGGMVVAPDRMKKTMEELKSLFELFQKSGGGSINDYFSFLKASERADKLNELGI